MTIITTEHGHKIEFNEDKHVYIHNDQYVVGMSTLLGKLAIWLMLSKKKWNVRKYQ